MKKFTYLFVVLAVVGAAVIAGCGGGGSSSSSKSESDTKEVAETSGGSGGGTVSVAEVAGLGPVLVDSEGMTVYEFTVDKGTTSECYGECEAAWPPVIAEGEPTAGEGAMSSDLGTTKRKDGSMQVTYNGRPLYLYSGDTEPGEANGQELDGSWFVLGRSGAAVKGAAEAEPAAEEEGEESSGNGYSGY